MQLVQGLIILCLVMMFWLVFMPKGYYLEVAYKYMFVILTMLLSYSIYVLNFRGT